MPCLALAMSLAIAPAGLAQAKPLRAAVGLAMPPYIIQESGRGLEVDIVREALAPAGYAITLDFMPFSRLAPSMEARLVDLSLTVNENSVARGIYYSDVHIEYRNVAVSLASRGLKIRKPADLAGKIVLAFGDAPRYLGPEFAAMAKGNPRYSEISDQLSQVRLLLSGRVDVVVIDRFIFTYIQRGLGDPEAKTAVTMAEIFPPTPYKVAFTSKTACEAFNAGLRRLRDSGRYDELVRTYLR